MSATAPKFRRDEHQSSLDSSQSCHLSFSPAHYRCHLSRGVKTVENSSCFNVVSCQTLLAPAFETAVKLKAVSFLETWPVNILLKKAASATEPLKKGRGSQFSMNSILARIEYPS